jgi:hypothetical protein
VHNVYSGWYIYLPLGLRRLIEPHTPERCGVSLAKLQAKLTSAVDESQSPSRPPFLLGRQFDMAQ